MLFNSNDDVRRAYNGTYVSYKGKVYYAITDAGNILLTDLQGNGPLVINSKKEFFFDPIELGYCPALFEAVDKMPLLHLSRRPTRQWQQGLSDKTVAAIVHYLDDGSDKVEKFAVGVRLDWSYCTDMLQKKYSKFVDVAANGGGGLSKDYGLVPNKFVLFNGACIGVWTDKGIGLYDQYFPNSIIRQDLDDLKVPTIWKEDEKEKENELDF